MKAKNAKQVIELLKEHGFVLERQGKGSHAIYTKENITVTVPLHGKKELKLKTLNSILKQAGIK